MVSVAELESENPLFVHFNVETFLRRNNMCIYDAYIYTSTSQTSLKSGITYPVFAWWKVV